MNKKIHPKFKTFSKQEQNIIIDNAKELKKHDPFYKSIIMEFVISDACDLYVKNIFHNKFGDKY